MKTLKGYIFWTYERGSLHYDVMVTLILAFIFITPHLWNYGDHPAVANQPPSELLVRTNGAGALIYQVPSDLAHAKDGSVSEAQLVRAIQPVSGPVTIDSYAPLRDASGRITAYKVWAHR
ncbi:MAG: hypothetical protein HIU93_06585 [Acidobacteria bacterium]|nr:hypothetical protein [Acidobacteriota bacterium]MBW4045121.1 hypothetical protein [Acidobacteriota bacterium]